MGALEIGASALRAAYAQLQTTGNNIANVNTPGYSRQRVIQAEAVTNFSGAGFMGRGVDLVTVERQYNDFLAREVHLANAAQAADGARAEALGRVDRILADTEHGIGAAYNALTEALGDFINRPFDAGPRSVLSQRAAVLAQGLATADERIVQIGADIDRSLEQQTVELNRYLEELAVLNERIGTMNNSVHQPNDLLDRRDFLVSEVNGLMKADAYINADQTVSLYAATGDALVLGTRASRVAIGPDTLRPDTTRLLLVTPGSSVPFDDALLGGGSIGGLLEARNRDLPQARAQLGQLAGALAHAWNTQQELGADLNGIPGGEVFRAGEVRSVAATTNAGNARFSAQIVAGAELQASDHELAWDGASYRITRLADGQVSTHTSLPAVVDGLEISLEAGAVAAGDLYTLRSASAFAADFSMVLASSDRWAGAAAVTPRPGASNSGSVTVAQFGVNARTAETESAVTITFTDPGTYSVSGAGTGDPSGLSYAEGTVISFNGWELALNGIPAAGDTITIAPSIDPGADNHNATRLLALADQELVGGKTITGAYGDLLAAVGARTQAAEASERASGVWLDSATMARDQASGVNLDEEAARLIQFQQAYQAAAKVISTSQQMFDALLDAVR